MKKHLLLFVLLANFMSDVFAHGPNEGCTYVFGSFGLNISKKPDENSVRTLFLEPGVNYFIRDNFSIGARAVLKVATSKKIKQSSSNGLDIFSRYYFTKNIMGVKGSFFLEANINASLVKNKSGNNVDGLLTYGAGFLPGFAIFPTKKVGFEFSLPNIIGFYTSSIKDEFEGSKFEFGPSSTAGPKFTVFLFID